MTSHIQLAPPRVIMQGGEIKDPVRFRALQEMGLPLVPPDPVKRDFSRPNLPRPARPSSDLIRRRANAYQKALLARARKLGLL